MSVHAGERAGRSDLARVMLRVAVALAVAAAGCAGPASAGRHGRGPDTGLPNQIPALLRSTDLLLPLDSYLLSHREVDRLDEAIRTMTRQCMVDLGFADYTAPEPAPWVGPQTWNERRYGLADPAQAARGYWPESRNPPPAPSQRRLVSAAENGAVTGRVQLVNGRQVPAGGCAANAQRLLRAGDPPNLDRYLSQRLSYQGYGASQQDPRVRAALAAWASCMNSAGYHYQGPLDPPKDPRFQGAVTALEIATAKTDVACKRRTNLIGVWFTVESAQQRSLIEANRPALELARKAFQAELAVASGVGA